MRSAAPSRVEWSCQSCPIVDIRTKYQYASVWLSAQLIPLYVCTGVGALGAAYYILRLATRNPDVTWSRAQNPEPNQAYRNKQYKVSERVDETTVGAPFAVRPIFYPCASRLQFYSPIRDYSKTESQAPKYEEDDKK